MSRAYEQFMEKKMAKKEALLDLPESKAESIELIEELKNKLEYSESKIVALNEAISATNSFKEKMKNHFVGGVIGALLGYALSQAV